jgi:hypothetical protein
MKLLLVLSAFLYPQTVSAADFRGNDWGDSPEAVVRVEGEPLRIETNGAAVILRYERLFCGYQAHVEFDFAPGAKLAGGAYQNFYGDDLQVFFSWVAAISEVYGEREKDDIIFTKEPALIDRFYAGGPDELAEGLKQNLYDLCYRWEKDNTKLFVLAWGDCGLIHTALSFRSVDYMESFLDSLGEGGMKEYNFY